MKPNLPIEETFRLKEAQKRALKKLGLFTVEDLLFHFPSRYQSMSEEKHISELEVGDKVTLHGRMSKLKASKAFRKKIPMAEGFLEDDTGRIKAVWFHQPYIAKMVPENALVKVEGKVSERRGELYLTNPEVERIGSMSISRDDSLFGEGKGSSSLFPVYPESRGVTSLWFYHAMQKVLKSGVLDELKDPIPEEILDEYNLPTLKTSLVWIHTPKKRADALSARKRFAFETVFFIQLGKQMTRKENDAKPSFEIKTSEEELAGFVGRFPFKPTAAQKKVVEEIRRDIAAPPAMSRLLEGDVGSGKTFVAAATSYLVVTNRPKGQSFGNLQVAYMAPTEVLAKQLFESFIEYFSTRRGKADMPIQVGLITGSGCKKFPSKVDSEKFTSISRPQLLKWVAGGEIPILIGTHALIQKAVNFKHLAYVIIDEQHRFGIDQRKALVRRPSQNERGKTQTTKNNNGLLYKDLTYIIREIIFTVKKELGLGHKEVVYQRAIEEELKKRKISFSKEVRIPIKYRGKNVGIYQPDFVIDNKIILELKALPVIGAREKKQLWTYLKGSKYMLGLLVNFGLADVSIERVVYQTARVSASSPHESAPLPHLLSMTATPIPRTLALTIFGDLDLSLLDEMPPGRKSVITEIVTTDKRGQTYEKIREEIERGRQAYVICPRVNEPDPKKALALRVRSVKEEAERLKKDVFPELKIEMLHGKMRPKEKEDVMERFNKGEADILVSTSVIEVGVNVPNATVIVIEGAERFGLAQLHQLRGRVLRSTEQAYCYIFADTKSKRTLDRLNAVKNAKNGFELAEYDLKFRGAGELSGKSQWGISDVGMEAIKNIKMVEAARKEAMRIVEEDPAFSKHPFLKGKLEDESEVHFE